MADRLPMNGPVEFGSTVSVAGVLTHSDTTDATSKTAGAAKFAGGVAVDKKIHAGEKLTVDSGGLQVDGGNIEFRGAGAAGSTPGDTGTSHHTALRKNASAQGLYTYQEEVSIEGTSNATDNAVVCKLSKTLPANAKIVKAGMTVTELAAGAGTQSLNLLLSAQASVAQGTAPTGLEELIGAATAAAAKATGALAAGSGGALGDTEATSFGFDVAAKTTAYVCADGTGNTVATVTAGKVLVTIEYFGSAAPA
tara:strand:+ start:38 stop:793 length:756 start_codon:yes stop_codon:yes gene_type:complete